MQNEYIRSDACDIMNLLTVGIADRHLIRAGLK